MRTLPLGYFALLSLLLPSCAHTGLYRDGKLIARFQGDMRDVRFQVKPDGTILLEAKEIRHSDASRAQGEAAANRLTALGSALTAAGVFTFVK